VFDGIRLRGIGRIVGDPLCQASCRLHLIGL
jgi:hypothetical protein